MQTKLIIISGPSGAGKGTILKAFKDNEELNLHFSVSCTTRSPRPGEVDGKDYYFITQQEFDQRVAKGEFIEYEHFHSASYGTLRSEVETRLDAGQNVLFDIDVKGAMNIKRIYGDRALSIFIMPPSIETLRQRLINRDTEPMEKIEERVARAEFEIPFADKFDETVINDVLEVAQIESQTLVEDFLEEE